MSAAETLRRAAELMRRDAQAAICKCGGPRCVIENWYSADELRARLTDGEQRVMAGDPVAHVLRWSPLASTWAALLLDAQAAALEAGDEPTWPNQSAALHLAKTYLGETP